MINNYVRVKIDNDLYKMRITSFTLQFPMTDKIDITFSNVTNCKTNTTMNIKEILDSAASIATSYDYVATQADKGAVANDQFVQIKNEGLNASLMNVVNSRDQDVVIDNHGILLRKKIHETDEYSDYQMKLINRNLVMTDDNWKTAKLAIGLGMYEGVPRYGVWADLLVGNLIAGEQLIISNDDGKGNHTVTINGEGIDILNGSFKVSKPNGCTVTIDPLGVYGENSDVFSIMNDSDERVMGIDSIGAGYFSGEIEATSGKFGQAELYEATVYVPDFKNLANVEPVTENIKTTLRNCTLLSHDYGMSERMIGTDENGNDITTFSVCGNILDLDEAFLQFDDLKLYANGIVKNMTSNYDDIHISKHYTKYWECTEKEIRSFYKGYEMSRGQPKYYNTDNSISFNDGEGAKTEKDAGLTSNITYKTNGTHIFEGNITGAINTKKMESNTTYIIKAAFEIGGGTAALKDLIQVKFGCTGFSSPLSTLTISANGIPSFSDISSFQSYCYSTLSATVEDSIVTITFIPKVDGTFIFSNEWNTTITIE